MSTLIILPFCEASPCHFSSLVCAAQQLGEKIDALWIGRSNDTPPGQVPEAIDTLYVYLIEGTALPNAMQVTQIVKSMPHIQSQNILMQSSTESKELLPRLSASFDIMPCTDVIKIELPVFSRPVFAGNIIEKISTTAPFHVSVRPGSFKMELTQKASPIQKLAPIANIPTSTAQLANSPSEEIDLTSAATVFSGGRGLGSKENFQRLSTLAKKYQAALGASRVAVDLGYISNDHQVGQTGKIIAPEVYVAFGISGAIQHLAGMKDAQRIIVINKDPSAPLFEQCDLGYTGDLFEIMDRLDRL